MIKNLLIIGVVMLFLAVLMILLSLLFHKVVIPTTDKLSKFIARKLKGDYVLVYLEILYMLSTIMFFIVNFVILDFDVDKDTSLRFLFFLGYVLFVIVSATTYHEKKLLEPSLVNIIDKIKRRKLTSNYFINRFILFMDQLCSTMPVIVALYISFLLFSDLQWSNEFYFVSVLFIPIYINVWVYFTNRGRFNLNSKVVFMRRFIVYLLIMIYFLVDGYNKFLTNIKTETMTSTFDWTNFYLYMAAVIYIALDRILKEIISDYERFKKDVESKS